MGAVKKWIEEFGQLPQVEPVTRVADAQIWTTHARVVTCFECQGEGRRIEAISGGVWNSYVGTYEPCERDAGECDECQGHGEIVIDCCDRCNRPNNDNHRDILREHGECQCSEETMLAFHADREAVQS